MTASRGSHPRLKRYNIIGKYDDCQSKKAFWGVGFIGGLAQAIKSRLLSNTTGFCLQIRIILLYFKFRTQAQYNRFRFVREKLCNGLNGFVRIVRPP
jgi:hypothetical protein